MVKCVFNAEDLSNRCFTCAFRSIKLAERFEIFWQYAGGFKRFSMDLWGETREKLPVISCNIRGFYKVYDTLYNKKV